MQVGEGGGAKTKETISCRLPRISLNHGFLHSDVHNPVDSASDSVAKVIVRFTASNSGSCFTCVIRVG